MRIAVKVVPRSKRARVVGWLGDSLKVAVAAAPEKGEANVELEASLATALGVPRAAVRVVAGWTTPRKTVEIAGLDEAEVKRRVEAVAEPKGT